MVVKRDKCPSARSVADRNPAADLGGSVLHDLEADAGLGRGSLRKTGAVILHSEVHGVATAFERKINARGTAVPDGIADGFLGDAEKNRANVLGESAIKSISFYGYRR